VGGIESVTLSDEEARRRGTQKTVLERRSPPTFDVLIEIHTRDRLLVHSDVAGAVDSLLRGNPLPPEIRSRDENGEIRIEKASQPAPVNRARQGFRRPDDKPAWGRAHQESTPPPEHKSRHGKAKHETVHIFPYGVARNRLTQAAKRLNVPIIIEKDISDAAVVVTLRTHFRKRQRTVVEAENRGTPVYVLRSNTVTQMEHFLEGLFRLAPAEPLIQSEEEAIRQTQEAVDTVLNGERWVELSPATAYIRRLQHQIARQSNLHSYYYGKDPNRRVRIYRE